MRGVDLGAALIGERWRVGSAVLEVSEPRFPCWKLGVRFDDPKMHQALRGRPAPGTYLRIAEEGELQAGDAVEVISRPDHDLTIAAFAHAFLVDRSQLGRLLIPEVSEECREWVAEQAA